MSASREIIKGLEDALEGNVTRVRVNGQTWVRIEDQGRDTVVLRDEFVPTRYKNGEAPDWHAGMLRAVAKQLGVGCDAYYPLLGAANKIEMFRQGKSYEDALVKEGGQPEKG